MERFPTLERYVLEDRIGQGGMAVVYRARHIELGTKHAIKVLSPAFQHIRERIVLEGRIQAGLDHPNLLGVTDVVDVAGAPGLVMPLVEGPTLHELMATRRLDRDEVDLIARGILSGVAEAHRLGIIHRDLKPANVLIRNTATGMVPKVADFGLAKMLLGDEPSGMGLSRTGSPIGTPAYMAPEQIRNGKDVDHRADIFAIGVVLYEMLSNRPLFERVDVLETMKAVTDGSRRPIREVVPDIPESYERAIECALDLDRDRRWARCEQMLACWDGRPDPKRVSSPPKTLPTPQSWQPPVTTTAGVTTPLSPGPTTPYYPAQPSRTAPMFAMGGIVLLGMVVSALGLGVMGAFGAGDTTEPEPAVVVVPVNPVVEEQPTSKSAVAPPIEAAVSAPKRLFAPKPKPAAAAPADPIAAAPAVLPVPFFINTRPPSRSIAIDGHVTNGSRYVGQLTPGAHRVSLEAADGRKHTLDAVVSADGGGICYDYATGRECE